MKINFKINDYVYISNDFNDRSWYTDLPIKIIGYSKNTLDEPLAVLENDKYIHFFYLTLVPKTLLRKFKFNKIINDGTEKN